MIAPALNSRHVFPMFAPLLLLLAVVVYRVVLGAAGMHEMTWLHNFSPLAAVALCGGLYLPRRQAFVLPLAILFVSDICLNLFAYHLPPLVPEMIPSYIALGISAWLGIRLRGRANWPLLIGASVAGSVIFYILSNTVSWLVLPAYAKTFGGWFQALTVGDQLPGHPSTLWFYRHTLISDVVFTVLFVFCMSFRGKSVMKEEAAAWNRHRADGLLSNTAH